MNNNISNIPESEQKILNEVEYLKDRYFTYDEPVPFCGLFLYPVSVRNYNEFMTSNACLLLNKNDDIQGIRYTNLDYLLNKVRDENEGPEWSAKLSRLVELCFHVKPGFKCNKCGKFVSYEDYLIKAESVSSEEEKNNVSKCSDCEDGRLILSMSTKKEENSDRSILVIDGHEINYENFNKMRKYILYQNLPDYYDDSWVPKAVREDDKKKNEILSKDGGSATLESKLCALSFRLSRPLCEIYDLSIRKYSMLIKMVNDYTEYETMKIGLSSGMVKLKDGQTLDHWLYKKENENRYGANVSAEELIKKIGK